jgi:endoribonuclease Dicer
MIRYLYNLDLELNPGEISSWRSLIVSNEVLSFALVLMGLDKYILHNSTGLTQDILRFLKHSNKPKLSEILYPYAGSDPSQNEEEYFSPPKVLGDIFESIIGAMFIDSNGDLKLMESFIMNFLIKPYLEPAMNSSVNSRWGLHMNPSCIMGEIVSFLGCTDYSIGFSPVFNSSSILCTIKIHGIEAKAKGYNKLIAKRLACSYMVNGDADGLFEKATALCKCKIIAAENALAAEKLLAAENALLSENIDKETTSISIL